MATLPTVPTFSAGSPSIATLNQLAYAVSFIVDQDVRPAWTYIMANGTQSVSSGTWTTVAFDHAIYDNDGVGGTSGASLPHAILVTQGYYAVESCVQVEGNATTTDYFVTAFKATFGSSNPHYTSGTTLWFGYRGGKCSSTAQAPADNAVCTTDITPVCMYPGDKIDAQVYISSAKTVDYNQNTSYIQGRFVTKFTGCLCRTGT